jgi:hypothetical protein
MTTFVIPSEVEESRCETLGTSTGSFDSAPLRSG